MRVSQSPQHAFLELLSNQRCHNIARKIAMFKKLFLDPASNPNFQPVASLTHVVALIPLLPRLAQLHAN
jgi:hypothetical protein